MAGHPTRPASLGRFRQSGTGYRPAMTLPLEAEATRVQTMAFGELTIAYDERVLRPRPWTADQSSWAAELQSTAPDGPVLELCSGAGQIGLLAVLHTGRELVCVDLNPVACDFARRNAEAAGLASRVEVRAGRLETALRPAERFPLVIADPPWVRRDDVATYPEDPLLAIDGGADGLDVARACLEVAARHLLPGGSALVQLGTRMQVARIEDDLTGGQVLVVREVRDGERGVLVRVERMDVD